MVHTSSALAAFLALPAVVYGGACKPVNLIMTRASGSTASFSNGTWSTKYGLSSVNTASLGGAFKYIMSETIDKSTGYEEECVRKNNVTFIHFYEFTICNTDAALWWFNYREAGYGGDEQAYRDGELGQYVTFDEGQCHDSPFCDYFHGNDGKPDLGPYVGFQRQANDPRAPTDDAYWYSLPGECPQSKWADKTDKCKEKELSGRCEDGVTPDGETCTWSYKMLGQVNVDELIGITKIMNPETGENFKNAQEYCKAGEVEFERDPKDYSFVSGLEFWENPTSRVANADRVQKLITFYNTGANNIPLPTAENLQTKNPKCFTSAPFCFKNGNEVCVRDSQQLCGCPDGDICSTQVQDSNLAFDPTALKKVALNSNKGDDSDSDSSSGAGLTTMSSMLAGFLACLYWMALQQ